MNEERWLASVRTFELLEFLRREHGVNRTRAGKRRLRLFACACLRRVWPLVEPAVREVVEDLEEFCDGTQPAAALKRLEERARRHGRYSLGVSEWVLRTRSALYSALAGRGDLASRAYYAGYEAAEARSRAAGEAANPHIAGKAFSEEADAQVHLLRDIFGNPFRSLKKRKFPPEVLALARAIDAGDGAAYPVLADALAELGEEQAALHCREALHVRGCHVLDWVLGRA
jgi:hypothetical protein